MHARHRLLRFVVATGLVLGAGVSAAQPAVAHDGGGGGGPQVKVMTQNLYLGSSLVPALEAQNEVEFVTAVATIYGTMLFTNFPARAQAIANEIATAQPDLIALQEVSDWVVTRPGTDEVLRDTDFLTILTAALAAKDLDYVVAATSNNADIGPAPLVDPEGRFGIPGCVVPNPVPGCLVEFHDRDVILVKDTPEVTWRNPKSGTYKVQQTFTPPVEGAEPVSFKRGWASIDVAMDGRSFRFFDTHLEVGDPDFVKVQVAQALELLARVLLSRPPVIVAGDFNSAAPPTTPGGSNTPTYGLLTKVLTDAWNPARDGAGLTCCQNETLTNYPSQLFERIDLVLSRGDVRAVKATTVGTEPFQSIPPIQPIWPSDHAGVVTTLQLG